MSAGPAFDPWRVSIGLENKPREPATYDRPGRVRLLGEAAKALLQGELPTTEARIFLGGAILSWLERGGNLERDFLQVTKPKSHNTPAALWREIQAHHDEGQDLNDADSI